MIYAGIGSRHTPELDQVTMRTVGHLLGLRGYTLRSGRAVGADQAFEAGARSVAGRMELFTADASAGRNDWMRHASRYHPSWERCGFMARRLHARNSAILLGENLDTPVDFVVCWTKNGGIIGGTGQGLRIAEALKIPVFNLRHDPNAERLWKWLPPVKPLQVEPLPTLETLPRYWDMVRIGRPINIEDHE